MQNDNHNLKCDRVAALNDDASTPALPSERIKGSRRNPEGSAAGKRGGIKLSKDLIKALESKAKAHNEKHGSNPAKRADVGALKAVARRGAGAFSVSHRPGMTRTQWALGRVNAFLHLLKAGKPKSPRYVTDNDLLPKDHPKYSAAASEPAAAPEPTTAAALAETVTPPADVAAEAREALEERRAAPPSKRAMLATGIRRATQLANRQPVSVDTLQTMVAWFARHARDIDQPLRDEQGHMVKGWQAWKGWGGTPGRKWATAELKRRGLLADLMPVARGQVPTGLILGADDPEVSGLPPKPFDPQDRYVAWIHTFGAPGFVYRGQTVVVDEDEIARQCAAFKRLTRRGYRPPLAVEHPVKIKDTDHVEDLIRATPPGERAGDVLALARYLRAGVPCLAAAVAFADPEARDKVERGQIRYFSPGLGPVETDQGEILPFVLKELSMVKSPHQKDAPTHVLAAELTPVISSNVDSVGREGDALRVKFHSGGVYDYPGAGNRENEMLGAPSKGKFLHYQIKGSYPYIKRSNLDETTRAIGPQNMTEDEMPEHYMEAQNPESPEGEANEEMNISMLANAVKSLMDKMEAMEAKMAEHAEMMENKDDEKEAEAGEVEDKPSAEMMQLKAELAEARAKISAAEKAAALAAQEANFNKSVWPTVQTRLGLSEATRGDMLTLYLENAEALARVVKGVKAPEVRTADPNISLWEATLGESFQGDEPKANTPATALERAAAEHPNDPAARLAAYKRNMGLN